MSNKIEFGVNGQKLRTDTINNHIFAEGARESVILQFHLSDSWDGYTVFAHFRQDDRFFDEILRTIDGTEDCCYLPTGIINGNCSLSLYGANGNGQILTTNCVVLYIKENGLISESYEMPQSVMEHIISMFIQTANSDNIVITRTTADWDTNKIYIYLGNGSEYKSKHWYYHNGNEWVLGGAYASEVFSVGDGLILDDTGTASVDIGNGLAISNNKVSVDIGKGLAFDGNHLKVTDNDGPIAAIKEKTDLLANDSGNAKFSGDVYAGGKKLATKEYVDNQDSAINNLTTALKTKTDILTNDDGAAKFSGDVYAAGNKLATEGYVDDLTDALDSRTDALESKVTALETTTAILTNDEGDAVFDGDVYVTVDSVAKKLATEESVGELTADKLAIVYLDAGDKLPTGDDIAEKTVYCLPNTKGGHDKFIYLPVTGKDKDECWEQLGGGSTAIVIDDGRKPDKGEEGVDYYILTGGAYSHKIYRNGDWFSVGQDETLATRVDTIKGDVDLLNDAVNALNDAVKEIGGDVIDTIPADLEYNADDDYKLFLTDSSGNRIGNGVTIEGGGGGGSGEWYSIVVNNTTEINGDKTTRYTVSDETKATDGIISFWWTAKQNGQPYETDATLNWYVNGRLRLREADDVQQGVDNKISRDVSEWLTEGTNTIVAELIFTGGERQVRQTKTWTITLTKYKVTWNLPAIAYYSAGNVSVALTVGGTGSKTLKWQIDNDTPTVIDNASGIIRQNITVASGVHTVSAWVETTLNGHDIATDKLKAITVCNVSTPTIVVEKDTFAAGQYDTVAINWMAAGADNTLTVQKLVRNDDVSGSTFQLLTEESVDKTMQTWRYKCTAEGNYTLKLKCGSAEETISLAVTESTTLRPVTDNLIMDVDPNGHSNQETGRDQFGYIDGSGYNHPFTFSDNFDWVNGGFQQDANGATALVIRRGTFIEFDRGLFKDVDATNKNGKSISIQFSGRNSVNYDATIGHSYNDGVGLLLKLHDATFSAGGNPITVQYCEDSIIEMGLNISDDEYGKIYKFWMGGVPAKANLWGNSSSFVHRTEDKFRIGSDDCDVWLYRFKMYNSGLTDNEMLTNYILDCVDSDELLNRYNRNRIYSGKGIAVGSDIDIDSLREAAPDLHIIVIETADFPAGKEKTDAVPCTVRHYKGLDASEAWEAVGAKYVIQGTTSTKYVDAAANLDIDMTETTMKRTSNQELPNGYAMTADSIPVKYFNLKANVASSENANNVCMADLFNSFNPLVSKAKSVNPKVRDSVEGHPCVVFITNTGEDTLVLGHSASDVKKTGRSVSAHDTVLYFAGDMNNSKKNKEVFGQDDKEYGDEDHVQVCVEFLENNLTRCLFKTHDFKNEWWDEDDQPADKSSHFGFRYAPKDEERLKAAKNSFIKMHEWVWLTDRYADDDSFKNDGLPKVYYGVRYEDTKEGHKAYRKAKFTNELKDYFDVDGLIYYYLFTEFMLSVDQRAKNTFCSYEPDANGNWRWNFSKFYDADSVLGIDNLGDLRLTYGLEDHPTTENTGRLSDNWVYDTPHSYETESVLWANLRECFAPRLETIYENNDTYLFDAKRIIDKFNRYQRIRPEALMIDSYRAVYDDPYRRVRTENYLTKMLNGEKREQREQFLRYQQIYMSSKYNSSKAVGDYINIRTNAGPNYRPELTITPYADMYACVRLDEQGEWMRKRVSKGSSVRIFDPAWRAPTSAGLYVFSASNILRLSTLAWLYPTSTMFPSAKKLTTLLIGDADYKSPFTLAVSPGTVKMAEEIDLRGQFLVGNTSGTDNDVVLDLSNNKLLKRLYIQNSGVTGVTFADGCPLNEARLGKKVKRIHAKNLKHVTAFTFENNDYSALQSLCVEDCVWVPPARLENILDNAFSLTNIRLTGVDLQWTDASTLMRIATSDIHGITADGVDDGTSDPIITGKVEFDNISDADKAILQKKFGNGLTIKGGGGSALHLVTFYNGTEVFVKEYVLDGGNATDPVNAGYGIPTKAADAHYTYAFSGWDGNLTNIKKDVDIYADYVDTVRTYRVTFFNGDEEIYHVDAQYGEDVQYSDAMAVAAGHTPYPQSKNTTQSVKFLCTGFSADNSSTPTDTFHVEGTINAKAQFVLQDVPSAYKPLNECTWAEIKAIVEKGSLAANGKWVANGIEWFATTYPSAATTANAKAVTINYTIYEDRAGTTGKKWSPYKDYYRGDADYIVTDKSDTILFFPCATNHDYKVTGQIRNGNDGPVLTDWLRFTYSTDQDTIDGAISGFRRQAQRTHSVTFLASQTLDFKTMFQSNTSNRVSWPNSLVRKILTGSGGNTTSVEYEQTVWNCLPFDLRAAITPVLKFSNSGPNTTTTSSDLHVDYVSIDRLFLPARGELISPITPAGTIENWYKETYEGTNDKGLYDCFTFERNRAVKDTNNVPVTYWLRTRAVNNSVANAVADVEASSGKVYSTNGVSTNASFSVLFGFCI